LATTYIVSQSLQKSSASDAEVSYNTNSRGTLKASVSPTGKITLDFPITHPRPFQDVLAVNPAKLALALTVKEPDIKDIQVDEAGMVYILLDEMKIDISTLAIDRRMLVQASRAPLLIK
jgi:hypothetical protein